MESEIENTIDIANKLLRHAKYDEGENMLQIARRLCSDPDKLQQIDDILKNYLSVMAAESNTINVEKETVDNMTEMEKAKQGEEEREIEVLRLSLMMRQKVILMGIDVFASKLNYRPEVNFQEVKYQLQYLTASSENCFSLNDYKSSENFMVEADNLYSEVAITLPEASLNSHVQNKPLNDGQNKEGEHNANRNDSTKNYNLNDPKTNLSLDNTGENQTSSTFRSYKVTVIGDEIDVARSLKIAETALLAGNLKKAEKWLVKSERMHSTEEAKELLKQLEAAKLRAAEAATKNDAYVGEVEEAIECFESEAADHKTEKKNANVCINIAQQALNDKNVEKAERFLMKAKRFNPDLDVEYLQNKLQAAKSATTKSTTEGSSQERFDLTNDYVQNSRKLVEIAKEALQKGEALQAKQLLLKARKYYDSMDIADLLNEAANIETQAPKLEETYHIPEPSYVDSNSETKFAHNAYDFSQPEISSPFVPSPDDIKKADNYVTTGRTALARNNLEKAEKFAFQADQLCPSERSKSLLDDIKKTRDLNKNIDDSKLRSGIIWKENDTKNTGVQTSSLKQEADMCLREAEKELLQGNLNEAENLVYKAQRLHECKSAKDLLQRIDAARLKNQPEQQNVNDIFSQLSTSNELKTKNCNFEDVQICVKKAEAAFSENNFDKADKLMKKAYRMYPDESFNVVITTIQAEKEMQENKRKEQTIQPNAQTAEVETEQPYNNNKQEAEKCVQLAEEAYNMKNFEKAKRLLLKAQRMDPTEYVESFLVRVQTENQKLKNTTIPNEDAVSNEQENEEKNDEESTGRNLENERKAEQYINKAVDAQERENYYVAELWLMKAEHAYPTDTGKELLENVRSTIKLNIRKPRSKNSPEQSETKQAEVKREAEKYLILANEKFNQNDLENAQSLALISDCFVPSSQAKELMERILNDKFRRDNDFKGKWKKGKGKKNKPNHYSQALKMFKADQYIEKAVEALGFGKMDLAEEYLKKSIEMNPSVKAKALLLEFHKVKGEQGTLARVQKYLLKQLKRLFW